MKFPLILITSAAVLLGTACNKTEQRLEEKRQTPMHKPSVQSQQVPERTENVDSGSPQPQLHFSAGDAELRHNIMKPAGLPASRRAGTAPAYEPSQVRPQQTYSLESYNSIEENIFKNSLHYPLSTFSVDVDTASYANIRRFITEGALPPVGAVRIEEMINYFHYRYPQPETEPFSLNVEIGPSPFHEAYRLVGIGLQGREMETDDLPPSNLVFLIDVSGSMRSADKLPLLKQSMKMLVDRLGPNDRVAIVVYAGSDRVVLTPTAGSEKERIYRAIDSLSSGGSTHGSKGIHTAYSLAERSFMVRGNNRVILASDGDFNIGVTSRGELQKLVEEKRAGGIYLSVLGFGMGNYHDDTMELLADKGNGNYAYIDSLLEAKKVMVRQMNGTLHTLAKDVKIQIEFNPALVGAYRLIGYENRMLEAEEFQNDSRDAGDIGVGHQVTALYEIVPAGHADVPELDRLKYQQPQSRNQASSELLTIKLRYKPPQSEKSLLLQHVVEDRRLPLDQTSDDFRFAAAVAGYGMVLKKSAHLGGATLEEMIHLARGARGDDPFGYRAECLRLMEMTELLQN